MAKTPAWQRAEGKNPKGGLNAKGRASAKAEGMNLKAPVKAGDNPRRASFLARMGNMPGPERDEKGKPTRLERPDEERQEDVAEPEGFREIYGKSRWSSLPKSGRQYACGKEEINEVPDRNERPYDKFAKPWEGH